MSPEHVQQLGFPKTWRVEKKLPTAASLTEGQSIVKFVVKSKAFVPAGGLHFSSSNQTAYSLKG
jgi:hypothetical protein